MTEPDQTYVQLRLRDAFLRVFDPSTDPSDGDISAMYVIDVFGISLLIRRRLADDGEAEVYVHVDHESGPATVVAIEVANGGDNRFTL